MAICNLFRKLTKETGNFLLFNQYTDDLTKSFVQHDNYRVVPSKFVALEIDYSKLKENFNSALDNDLNVAFPTYMQNYFENGCAWLKTESPAGNPALGQSNWNPNNWNPKYAANLFWNALIEGGLIQVQKTGINIGAPYKYDENWDGTCPSNIPSFESFNEIRYIGNLDIHSYEVKDGIGYSEIYCYIPNDADRTLYKVTDILNNQTKSHIYQYHENYIMGASAETENILGTLPVAVNFPINYLYEQKYSFAAYEYDGLVYDGPENIRNYKECRNQYNGTPADNYFQFNTIIILYNVLTKDSNGNVSVAYKDIPMGMYLTGLINNETIGNTIRGSVTNTVIKYSECMDAYGSGTSYGLRICTRFMCTPNSTSISSIELDANDQYAGFSMAMNKIAESQEKMDAVLKESVEKTQNMKDYLAEFRNGKTNVPYIRQIGNDYYWFVNGKNTGVFANGHEGKPGKNGTLLRLVEYNGSHYWEVDGQMTNVCAEGRDGAPGVPGDPGTPGEPGHSPILALKTVTVKRVYYPPVIHGRRRQATEVDVDEIHYFIDNVDTGIRADAPSISIEDYDGRKWLYIDGIRHVCVEGKDGYTPTIQTEGNGKKYWFINGQSTGILAEATNGKSIFVTKTRVSYAGTLPLLNPNGEDWTTGDIILYLGDTIGSSHTFDLYKLKEWRSEYNLFAAKKIGNVGGSITDNIQSIDFKVIGKNMEMILNGDKSYKFKNFMNKPIQYSTKQHKFVHLNDRVYCCNTGNNNTLEAVDSGVYVEIPYKFGIEQVGDKYNAFIQINDSRYINKHGYLSVLSTNLYLPNIAKGKKAKKLVFSTQSVYSKTENKWVKRGITNNGVFTAMPMDETYANKHDGVLPSGQIVHSLTLSDNKMYIWNGLTFDEICGIKNSYHISKHIGRVCLYVKLTPLISESNGNIKPNTKGILYYSKNLNSWVCEPTNEACTVQKHNMLVNGDKHAYNGIAKPIAHSFDEFISLYDSKDLYFRSRTKCIQKACPNQVIDTRQSHTIVKPRKSYVYVTQNGQHVSTISDSGQDVSGVWQLAGNNSTLSAWMSNRIRYDKYKPSWARRYINNEVTHTMWSYSQNDHVERENVNIKFTKYKYRFIEYKKTDSTRIASYAAALSTVQDGQPLTTYQQKAKDVMSQRVLAYSNWCKLIFGIPTGSVDSEDKYTSGDVHVTRKIVRTGRKCAHINADKSEYNTANIGTKLWPTGASRAYQSPYIEVAVKNGNQYDVYHVSIKWNRLSAGLAGNSIKQIGNNNSSMVIDNDFVNNNLNLGFTCSGRILPYSNLKADVSEMIPSSDNNSLFCGRLSFVYKYSINSLKNIQ